MISGCLEGIDGMLALTDGFLFLPATRRGHPPRARPRTRPRAAYTRRPHRRASHSFTLCEYPSGCRRCYWCILTARSQHGKQKGKGRQVLPTPDIVSLRPDAAPNTTHSRDNLYTHDDDKARRDVDRPLRLPPSAQPPTQPPTQLAPSPSRPRRTPLSITTDTHRASTDAIT